MAADSRASGHMQTAAGQERKPDAGASAGEETLMMPVARRAEGAETSGAKYALSKAKVEGSPEIAPEAAHPHAGESGVGSNAGPICIGPHVRSDSGETPGEHCSLPPAWTEMTESLIA